MPQDSQEGFKVTDRRRRDEDQPPRPGEPTPPPAGVRDRVAGEGRSTAAPPGAAADRNLGGLFMMLATEAVIALGDAPDPVTGQRQRALPHAAEVIDLLLLLREKTEGNRTSEETQILDELLYDLQLRYVRATKSVG
jgi:Domain of unknown function (DUF1844)